MSIEEFIIHLNGLTKNHFDLDYLYFQQKDLLTLNTVGNNPSLALFRKKNDSEKINVIEFVQNIWVYCIITLKSFNPVELQSFSLTAFNGTKDENIKQHLFRAEWDNYPGTPHPQAHWHFYSNEEIDYLKKQFQEIVDVEAGGFLMELANETEKNKIPFQKMHFAMNSRWHDQQGHVYCYDNPAEFINWLDGLLNHLKMELNYCRSRI